MRTRNEVDVTSITLDEVMRLINPRIKKIRQTGEMQVMCPLNPKEDFDINTHTGNFKCWHNCPDCPVGGKGNSVNLYRLFNPNLSFGKAVRAITEHRMTPDLPSRQVIVKPKPIPNANMTSIEERDKTYRAFLSCLTLSDEHRENFRKRGLSDEQIDELGVKSIPSCGVVSIPAALKGEGFTLKGVPLFGMRDGQWRLGLVKGKTGCYVPYYDREGRIQQLQIRYDIDITPEMTEKEVKEQKNNRYRWATSGFLYNGCSATNIVFWGRAEKFKNEEVVYITEGGIKASVASYLSNLWFVGTTSASTTDAFAEIIDWCKENHKIPVDAYDMDGKILPGETVIPERAFKMNKKSYPAAIVKEMEAGSNRILVQNKSGKYRVVNGNVKRSLERFHEIAQDKGVQFYTWYWDPEYKGIDDYLLAQTYRGGDLTWDGAAHISDDADNTTASEKEKGHNTKGKTFPKARPKVGQIDPFFIPKVF